jgi:hypothetical protein
MGDAGLQVFKYPGAGDYYGYLVYHSSSGGGSYDHAGYDVSATNQGNTPNMIKDARVVNTAANTMPDGFTSPTAMTSSNQSLNTSWYGGCSGYGAGGAAQPATAPITDYIAGLVQGGATGAQTFAWQWIKTFTGGYTFKRSSGANVSENHTGGNQTSGSSGKAVDTCGNSQCTVNNSPWTLTINDTGRNKVATYVITGAQPPGTDKLLLGAAAAPRVTNVNPGTSWTVSTNTLPTFSFTVEIPGATSGSLGAAACVMGLLDTNTGGVDGANLISVTNVITGTRTFSSVNVVGPGTYTLICTNDYGTSGATFVLNADGTTQGGTGSRDAEACGPIDAACAVRNAFRDLKDALSGIIDEALRTLFVPNQASIDSWNALLADAKLRQPFVVFYGAGDAIEDAAGAGDARPTMCWTWALGLSGVSAPWTVCPTDVLDYSGYGVVRSVMVGGVYLALAAHYFTAWSPRPSL